MESASLPDRPRRGRPPKVREAPPAVIVDQPGERPAKVDYKDLAGALCDLVIGRTAGLAKSSRYWVCVSALRYAMVLLPRSYREQQRRDKDAAALKADAA